MASHRRAAAFGLVTALLGAMVAAPPAGAEDPVCSPGVCGFFSPSGAVNCEMNVQRGAGIADSAYCTWTDHVTAHSAILRPDGTLAVCVNPAAAADSACQSDPPLGQPALAAGDSAVLGPFRCVAQGAGISCTAAPSGRGFVISAAGVVPIS